jgi:hypothetical protein
MAKGIAVATGPKGGKAAAPFAAKVGAPVAVRPPPPPTAKSPRGMTGPGGAPAFKKGGKVKK